MKRLRLLRGWIGFRAILYFYCQVIVFSGCQFIPNQSQGQFSQFHFPLPTKDEVAIIDGRPLTLSHFLAIRSRLQTASTPFTLWVGTAMFTLQNEGRLKHREITPLAAFTIARYAMGELPLSLAIDSLGSYFALTTSTPSPEEVRKEIDRLARNAIILKNSQILSQI